MERESSVVDVKRVMCDDGRKLADKFHSVNSKYFKALVLRAVLLNDKSEMIGLSKEENNPYRKPCCHAFKHRQYSLYHFDHAHSLDPVQDVCAKESFELLNHIGLMLYISAHMFVPGLTCECQVFR